MPLRRQYYLGMKKIKLAYFGSPDFAADFLEKILLDKSLPVEIKLVVTQPDQLVGRKQILTPTPVKKVEEKFKRSEDIIPPKAGFGIKLKNIDLVLVYAYGELIPKELLNLPKYGFWCIHPSLLPKYRGPSPIAAPLINGDEITGVTIIKMDEEIDHGPIIAQQSLTIKKTDKRPDLEKKLTDLAYEMFKKTVFNKDSLQLKPQDDTLATYTKKLEKSDGFISLEILKKAFEGNGAKKIYNLFRGLYPWPGIWTILPNGKRLKITNLVMKQLNNLIIESVQLEGKKEVDFKTFNDAYKIF